MVELLDPLYSNTLQEISIWQDRHFSSSAMIFMNSILATPFIISLDILQKHFSYTLPLIKQCKQLTVVFNLQQNRISVIVAELRNVRN